MTRGIKSVIQQLGWGLLVTLLLVCTNMLLEKTATGHRAEALAYEFLQSKLSPFVRSERLPILVVDISKIPGGKDQVTPREALKQLTAAIVAQHPSAIAIDIDFSPNDTGWKTDDDAEFLDYCLKLKRERGVPIFLGVYETRAEHSDTWLGLAKYKELAGAGFTTGDDVTKMPRWIQVEGESEKLPTLSAALAGSYQSSLPAPSKWLERFVEVNADHHHGNERQIAGYVKIGETLVNYSKLEQIQHETLTTISPASVAEASELFLGRMVLLGDATRSNDSFIVPNRDHPVAGVYLEACAAYTLAEEPLYELRYRTRILLDLLISIAIISGAELISHRFMKNRTISEANKWRVRFIYAAIIVVILTGVLLIQWLNIMWLDFFLVIFALILHPSVDRWVAGIWGKLKSISNPTQRV